MNRKKTNLIMYVQELKDVRLRNNVRNWGLYATLS